MKLEESQEVGKVTTLLVATSGYKVGHNINPVRSKWTTMRPTNIECFYAGISSHSETQIY
jgi:hypothetical protein